MYELLGFQTPSMTPWTRHERPGRAATGKDSGPRQCRPIFSIARLHSLVPVGSYLGSPAPDNASQLKRAKAHTTIRRAECCAEQRAASSETRPQISPSVVVIILILIPGGLNSSDYPEDRDHGTAFSFPSSSETQSFFGLQYTVQNKVHLPELFTHNFPDIG